MKGVFIVHDEGQSHSGVMRNQAERILRDLDIVKREEFEAVKEMARLAREENEALKARLAGLEAKLGGSAGAPNTGS